MFDTSRVQRRACHVSMELELQCDVQIHCKAPSERACTFLSCLLHQDLSPHRIAGTPASDQSSGRPTLCRGTQRTGKWGSNPRAPNGPK